MTASAEKQPNKPYKICLAGFGKMGLAMAKSWARSGLIERLDIFDPFAADGAANNISNAHIFKNNNDYFNHARDWDIFVLAIKPQTFDEFIIPSNLPESLPVLSIMAGKTLADISLKFNGQNPVIRAMPNTPASIGMGMTVAVSNTRTTATHKSTVDDLMSAMGKFLWAKSEQDMNAVTALSGSGPAYVFYMIEAMAKAGINAGLDADFAIELARQTVTGAGALSQSEGQTPIKVLRENVTSPHGTTAAGLAVLMDGRFQDIMHETIKRAANRSKELSET